MGALRAGDLLDLAVEAEASGAFDAVWVGDSLLAKPRLEAVTLLSALAGATRRVRLGVACLATFVHRHPVLFAHQWASLDVLSGGRAWLVVCVGGPDAQSPAQAREHAVMGIRSDERPARLEEGIILLRRLFHETEVSHAGRFYRLDGVTIEPRPAQQPSPIWIASNPTGLTWKGGGSAPESVVERNLRRVARLADGWMTNKVSPARFREQWTHIAELAREEGRDPARLGSVLYHNLNVNEDRPTALAESQAFLDRYYSQRFTPAFVEGWTAAGSPARCAEELSRYFEAGVQHITLRLASWDQRGQLARFLGEIAPAVLGDRARSTPAASAGPVAGTVAGAGPGAAC